MIALETKLTCEQLLTEAKILASKGQFQEALLQYTNLIEECKIMQEYPHLLTSYKDICGVLVLMGQMHRVVEYSDDYLFYCERYGSDVDYLSYYNLMATVKLQLELYQEAIEMLDKMAQLAQKLNNHPYYLMAIGNKLHIYDTLNEFELGYRHFKQYESLFHEPDILGMRLAYFAFKINGLAILAGLNKYDEMQQPLNWLEHVSLEGFHREEMFYLYYKEVYALHVNHDMSAFARLKIMIEQAEQLFDHTLLIKLLEDVLALSTKFDYEIDSLEYAKKLTALYKALHQKELNQKVAEANAKLQVHESKRIAYLDSLTQCYNRRYFDENQAAFMKLQANYKYCVVLDMDRFKEVNDTYGHAFGDVAIQTLAKKLEETFAHYDAKIMRFGGDEFVVWINSKDSLREQFDQFHRCISPLSVADDQVHVACTLSIGVATWDGKSSFSEWFERADQALYTAKQNGRAQVYLIE